MLPTVICKPPLIAKTPMAQMHSDWDIGFSCTREEKTQFEIPYVVEKRLNTQKYKKNKSQ